MDFEPGLRRRDARNEVRHFHSMTDQSRLFHAGITFRSLLLAAALLAGCDKNQLAPIDSRNFAPLVSQLTFSPDSVYLDALTPSNGEYTVTTTVRARASDSDGNLSAVTADLFMADGSLAAGGIPLHDDGSSPDSVAGDGIFSRSLQFQVTRAQAGSWQIRVSAIDDRGASSNFLSGRFRLARRNAAPWIFGLNAPDSLTRPTVGSFLFFMAISAADSDGLTDIQQVYFRNLDSPSQQRIFLLDDGGVLHNGITSGDSLAGDGRFSVIVQLPDTVSARTFHFQFQAADSFGDTSASLIHSLTVR